MLCNKKEEMWGLCSCLVEGRGEHQLLPKGSLFL